MWNAIQTRAAMNRSRPARFRGEGAGGLKFKRGSTGAGSGDAERDSEGEESREDNSSSFSLSA